ncbi:GPI-N-acetylgalactosamine transferase PGAP4-like [Glandiceps talaboti]
MVNSAIQRRITAFTKARAYFSSLSPIYQTKHLDENHQQQQSLKFAVGILTMHRVGSHNYPGYEPKYLTEVGSRIHQLLKRRPDNNVVVAMCNVDHHPHQHTEVVFLSKYIRRFTKYEVGHESDEERLPMNKIIYPSEQKDYLYCLDTMSKFNASYTLILQDDALLRWDFFEILEYVLKTKIENNYQRGELVRTNDFNSFATIKLHFPEKWQGFSWTESSLFELLVIGCTGGLLLAKLYWFFNRRIKPNLTLRMITFFLSVVYFVLVLLLVGRQHLLELCRLSKHLYMLKTAPDCCIPAVLYNTRKVKQIVDFLKSIECSPEYPIDIAISEFVRQTGMRQHYIVPNLVDHIGMFSTLHREPKNPEEFLNV